MKPSLIRFTAAALLCAPSALQAAPKKTEPAAAPAAEQAPAPKKGFFSKVKSALPFKKQDKKKEQAEAAKPEASKPAAKTTAAKPVAKQAPAAPAKPVTLADKLAARKNKPAETKTPPAAQPEKKVKAVAKTPEEPKKPGFFKGLFSRSDKKEKPATEPKLAAAKTAKPAPVKDKTEKPEELAQTEKPKRGFLGFFKKLGEPLEEDQIASTVPDTEKIERPDDWAEYSVIRDDEVALYEFGPSQLGGADARLNPGTLVKITKREKGWAVVEVQGENKYTGYIDARAMRAAEKGDFNDPPPPPVQMASYTLDPWAPLAPPPDLPDEPGTMDASDALLLLPPLELEPKP